MRNLLFFADMILMTHVEEMLDNLNIGDIIIDTKIKYKNKENLFPGESIRTALNITIYEKWAKTSSWITPSILASNLDYDLDALKEYLENYIIKKNQLLKLKHSL